jgi:hypothetical protein
VTTTSCTTSFQAKGKMSVQVSVERATFILFQDVPTSMHDARKKHCRAELSSNVNVSSTIQGRGVRSHGRHELLKKQTPRASFLSNPNNSTRLYKYQFANSMQSLIYILFARLFEPAQMYSQRGISFGLVIETRHRSHNKTC